MVTRLAVRPDLAFFAPVVCLALALATTEGLIARQQVSALGDRHASVDRGIPRYQEATDFVSVGLDVRGRQQRLAPKAAAAWRERRRAAKSDGVRLLLVSAFRSVDEQRRIFARKLGAGQALAGILATNLPPGFSEHHTGTAVDLATRGSTALVEDFEQTAAFHWLEAHAHLYGFSLSYPRGNSAGLMYEPWRWAYRPAAPFTGISRLFHARLHGEAAHAGLATMLPANTSRPDLADANTRFQ